MNANVFSKLFTFQCAFRLEAVRNRARLGSFTASTVLPTRSITGSRFTFVPNPPVPRRSRKGRFVGALLRLLAGRNLRRRLGRF